MKPAIGFDIKVPRASESGKALINRVKSDPDELNRQFLFLLIFKKFQPLQGASQNTGGNAAYDLVTTQINSVLSQMSDSYKMGVNVDANTLTGDRTFEFGVSKEFLDDRLIVTGSFGVEQGTTITDQSQNQLIGDVSVEYLLNESGTFRVNIFNESNQKSILQTNNQGLFKQGIGLNYQEDFNGYKDFKLWQSFLNIFRKNENKKFPDRKKKNLEKVPALKPEEKSKGNVEGK